MILVNLYLGSTDQGGFAMITTIISMVHTAVFALTDTIEPIIYKCYAERRTNELSTVLYTSTKLISVLLALPMIFLIVFSHEFLGALVGSDYAYLSSLLTIGLFGDFAYCVIAITNVIPRVYLKVQVPTLMSFILGIINAGMTMWILSGPDKNVNSAMAIWAGVTLGLAVFNSIYNSHLTKVPVYKYGISIVEGYAIMLILYYPLKSLRLVLDLPPMWIPLIVTMIVLFCAYFIIAYLIMFNKNEKKLVNAILPEKISRYIAKIARN